MMPNTIKYVQGNMFQHLPYYTPATKVIPHICNDVGAWGAGFVVPLAEKWPRTRHQYKEWHGSGYDPIRGVTFELGHVAFVQVAGVGKYVQQPPDAAVQKNGEIYVVNMIGQHKTGQGESYPGHDGNPRILPPVRYGALSLCMAEVRDNIDAMTDFGHWQEYGVEIHAPMFGAGLAGGDWNVIAGLIKEFWLDEDIPVTIYHLEDLA